MRLAQWVVTLLVTGLLAGLGVAAVRTARMDAALQPVLKLQDLPGGAAQSDLDLAIRMRPDLSQPWQLQASGLSTTDPAKASLLAARATQIDPMNWQNWQTLGLLDYQLGRIGAAQDAWNRAAQLNTGYDAHFEAANLAFLLGDSAGFWREMQAAMLIAPPGEVMLALQSIAHLQGDDPEPILRILPRSRADVGSVAIDFMIQMHQLGAATEIWNRLDCPLYQHEDCKRAALDLVTAWQKVALATETQDPAPTPSRIQPIPGKKRLAGAAPGHVAIAAAMAVWNHAVQVGIIPAVPVNVGAITDSNFQFPDLGGFAWQRDEPTFRLLPASGASSGNIVDWLLPGDQPDHVPLMGQWMAISTGNAYRYTFASRLDSTAVGSGVHLTVTAPGPRPIVLASAEAALNGEWHENTGTFTVPAGIYIVRVEFDYDRPTGSPLLQGHVFLRGLHIEPTSSLSKSSLSRAAGAGS